MKTFKVEIMPCGTKAKTVNPLGKHVVCNDPCYCFNRWQCDKFKEWAKEENSRKVYEIETVKIPCMCDKSESVTMCFVCTEREYNPGEYIKPGTIVEATEINTKQIRIL